MNSTTKEIHPSISSPRVPYQFLTRNLYVTSSTELPFIKVCLQRVYLKNLRDDPPKHSPRQERIFRSFKHNKLFKTLKSAQFSSLYHPYIIESLKTSKSLQRLQVNSTLEDELHPTNVILLCLKRLPNKIQSLSLNVEIGPPVLYKIGRSLGRFPKIQHFSRWCNKMFFVDDETDHVSRELKVYKESKLRRKISVFYTFGHNEVTSFQRAVNSSNIHQEIFALEIKLHSSDFANHEGLASEFWSKNFDALDVSEAFEKTNFSEIQELPEITEGSENLSQSTIDPDCQEENEKGTVVSPASQIFLQDQIVKEIAPFYRFELFPNLKTLKLIQEDALYPLGSFVTNGFAALQNLQDFEIFIGKRSMDTIELFKGFLRFPLLLQRFSLNINFIRGEEWALLQQFLEPRNRLESLQISLREKASDPSHYKKRNIYVQNIIKSLNGKSFLRSLTLEPHFISLAALSPELCSLRRMKNQLHTFRFEVIDDMIISQETFWTRTYGLCEFIRNQKGSLQVLKISIPFVFDDQIINAIGYTISTLGQLKILDIQIQNEDPKKTEEIQIYLSNFVQKDSSIKSTEDQKWNPTLAKHLLRLKNLEGFRFRIGLPDLYKKGDHEWFLDVMKVLTRLKRLQNIFIVVDDGAKLKAIEKKLCKVVNKLKSIREIYMIFWKAHPVGAMDLVLPELRRALEKVNERQRKNNFFFAEKFSFDCK